MYSLVITQHDESINSSNLAISPYSHIYVYKKNDNFQYESCAIIRHIINNYDTITDTLVIRNNKLDCIRNIIPPDFKNNINKIDVEKDDSFVDWIRNNVEKNIDGFIENNTCDVLDTEIFLINKSNILSRPLDFYKKLIKNNNFIDRSLYYIFNMHKVDIINNPNYVIIGSGLSGAVIAEQLSMLQSKPRIL